MINTALAIYPVSSKRAIAKNNKNIIGTNIITEPTPPITPSTIKD